MDEIAVINSTDRKILNPEEESKLNQQNTRLVSEFKVNDLEKNARKYWDLFYKRNENRFFKDRHWTTREFTELLAEDNGEEGKVLFEIGCGVGNFLYPLIELGLNLSIIGCDLSPRAVEIVKSHKLYDSSKIQVFQADITEEALLVDKIDVNSVDIATLIFVLSAIHPDKFVGTLRNVHGLLKTGGILLFRDYGLYDMAQIRFKAGHKIAENFYMRQDGTRSYYFSVEYLKELLEMAGFRIASISYVHRRTINKKENVDEPRIFVQAKAFKT